MPERRITGSPRALVVFVDENQCRWLHGLRRGFRHCFAAIAQGEQWIICDSLKNRLELSALPALAEGEIVASYGQAGHHVLTGIRAASAAGRPASLELLTCVAVVKRLLGIHAPLVVTPWQLFRHLVAKHGFVLAAGSFHDQGPRVLQRKNRIDSEAI